MFASSATQRLLLLVLVMLLAGIGIVLLVGRGSGETQTAAPVTTSKFAGPTMPPGVVAKDFSLTDQHGRRVSLSSYRGHVVIVTFIHSLCQDDCPFMVEQIKGALNDMPGSGQGIPTIGVSVAPKQDTIANRRKFLTVHRMNDRIAFVNGPVGMMRRIWHAYAIAPGTGPQGHSAVVVLIDKKGVERVGFGGAQVTPEELAHDLRVLQAEPA